MSFDFIDFFSSIVFAVNDCCIVPQFGSPLQRQRRGKKSMKVTLAISCYSAFTSIPNSSDIAYFSEASSSFLLCSVQFQLEPAGEIGCSQRGPSRPQCKSACCLVAVYVSFIYTVGSLKQKACIFPYLSILWV